MNHANARLGAKKLIMAMPVITRFWHDKAWKRTEAHFHDTAKKTDKIFEVHHRVEIARERYFQAIVDGYSPASCEEIVLESFKDKI